MVGLARMFSGRTMFELLDVFCDPAHYRIAVVKGELLIAPVREQDAEDNAAPSEKVDDTGSLKH